MNAYDSNIEHEKIPRWEVLLQAQYLLKLD